MSNPFVHVELHTQRLAQAKDFYQHLFDWKIADTPQMDYTMIDVGKGTGGGMMGDEQGQPTQWLPYVLVDDIRVATNRARELGATIHKDVTEIPGMGWYSVILDPTGAALGMWQTRAKS